MKKQYSVDYIRERLKNINERVEGETSTDKKENIIRILGYEFGVDLSHYDTKMPDGNLIKITYLNQTYPSQLLKDLKNETEELLNLKP